MMTKERPIDFNKRFDIVGCFVEHNGKLLLLHRHAHKASGGKWGLPAGKMDPGEDVLQAVFRETQEETGLTLASESIEYFDSLYVRDGDFDIEWHMFATKLADEPVVTISPEEHLEYRWVTPEEPLEMDLVHDLSESIRLFYHMEKIRSLPSS